MWKEIITKNGTCTENRIFFLEVICHFGQLYVICSRKENKPPPLPEKRKKEKMFPQ
jgi:hypothetical protein